MSENIKKLSEYVDALNRKRAQYEGYAKEKIAPIFAASQRPKRRPPQHFKDSSFMFIRSFAADSGSRPFSGIVFWLSPDIQISPMDDLGAYTTTLQGGKLYDIACTVRNSGDLNVPAAKVEFFLCTPSLGFDTRYAEYLGVAQLREFLPPLSSRQVHFPYLVPPSQSGHKCLFARVFSFSPLDIPNDPYNLDPRTDRHVAQLNLNFLAQAASMPFQLVHLPNANETVQLRMMTRDELLGTRHPILGKFKINENLENARLLLKTQLAWTDKDVKGVKVINTEGGFRLSSQGGQGMGLAEQKQLFAAFQNALKLMAKGAPKREFKPVFDAMKKMNEQALVARFQLALPTFNLAKDEVFGFHVSNNNTVFGNKGGFSVFVVGDKL